MKEYLINKMKEFDFVKNYHLEIKHPTDSLFTNKSKVVVRVWVNKELRDIYDVTQTLLEQDTFEQAIKKIAADYGNYTAVLDIYEN